MSEWLLYSRGESIVHTINPVGYWKGWLLGKHWEKGISRAVHSNTRLLPFPSRDRSVSDGNGNFSFKLAHHKTFYT